MSDIQFDEIEKTAHQEATAIQDAGALEEFRIKYLGRKGLCSRLYSTLSSLAGEEKPVFGKRINDFKNAVTRLYEDRKQSLERSTESVTSGIDATLPGVTAPAGHTHLLTQIVDEICDIFKGMGFVVQESPEIETECHNFGALNIPIEHPSRDAFDTFYVKLPDPEHKDRQQLLRSHTSPGQIRIMRRNNPPLAVVVPGKVYRPDAVDASHSFMFHQIEGLLVDRRISFSDLKGLLTVFCRRFFGENITMRFRPHFFPFTEPSAEVDISWEHGRKDWLEIMGCGLVHPNVFEAVGYPGGKYTGLAFGMGVERMAMLRYGIKDIRTFYENDIRFLKQY